MRSNELYGDVINEDAKYEFKAKMPLKNNIKWAKNTFGLCEWRSGSGFKTIYDSYADAVEDKMPIVLTYPGFLLSDYLTFT